ncbi:VOC family protein [Lacticaseibacillus daqingensis]|uniref:VOC family protein n=1 Tax=Lacticaseibacillus daqingensis TaxID=2486014 RepID=UPI000F7A1062|nr:VOC family protein [Lacticaseibacillus daqingensis]
MTRFVISPQTRVGFISIRVHNLDAMRAWYSNALGLVVLQDNGVRVLMGIGADHHVILDLEAGGRMLKQLPAGVAGYSLNVPSRVALLGLAAGLTARGVPVLGWHQTGFSLGFAVRDPEQNLVLVEYDRGTQADVLRGYDFADGRLTPVKQPRQSTPPLAVMPGGTRIGRFVIRTADFATTTTYLRDVLGFVRQQHEQDFSFLTSGDAVRHIGATVQLDVKARPRRAEHAGVQYVNLVVPDKMVLARMYANLVSQGWHDFYFDPGANYLMVTGPNRLTLWFSVR